jgi:hypothetical protein
MVLPQNLVERLGLRITDQKVMVAYADERTDECPVAGELIIRVGEQDMETQSVVGLPRSEPLLGQIVLERLDLLVDCTREAWCRGRSRHICRC